MVNESGGRGNAVPRVLLWIARFTGTAVVALLTAMVFGERGGNGPDGAREWLYLALFPFGFSVGYLLGWRWPLLGGCVSLACMAISQVVIGRVFGVQPYMYWGLFSVPGVLYVIAGLKLRGTAGKSEVQSA